MARKTLVLGVAALAIVVVIAALPDILGQSQTLQAQTIETAIVQRTTLSTTIESTGSIAAARSIGLTFEMSGRVETVDVEAGDRVSAGDVLATLDISSLEYQVALREQALAVQQANYDALLAPPTAAEIAQAQANLASAQSQLISAQSNLAAAPNQNTINCTALASDEQAVAEAESDYQAYLVRGYEWDAAFIPDPDSREAQALRDAQRAYDVTLAQCQNTNPITDYEAQVASAQAGVDQAQAALNALLADPSSEDIAAAQAQLEQTRLELENARSELADATLIAPFDGVITAVNLVVGQSVTNGTQVMTLQDIDQLHIDVSVDEMDIPQVQTGQTAIIRPDALRDQELRGQVSRISPAGTVTDGIVTFSVRVDLDEQTSLPVFVGMTTSVEILITSEEAVLVLPTDAIQRAGTREFVQVQNADGTTQPVDVTTGSTVDGQTVIIAGVTEGTEVVIPATTQNAGPGGFGGPFGG